MSDLERNAAPTAGVMLWACWVIAPAVGLVVAFAAASATAMAVPGGDDTTPVTVPGGSYGDEFCNTWIVIEQAFANTPEDPAEMAEWYADNGAPLVAEIREYAPEAIADPVNVYMEPLKPSAPPATSTCCSPRSSAMPRRPSTRPSRRVAGYRSSRRC